MARLSRPFSSPVCTGILLGQLIVVLFLISDRWTFYETTAGDNPTSPQHTMPDLKAAYAAIANKAETVIKSMAYKAIANSTKEILTKSTMEEVIENSTKGILQELTYTTARFQMRVLKSISERPSYFMHIVLHFDRATDPLAQGPYIDNFNEIIRTSTHKVFYHFTVMGPQTHAYIEKNVDMTKPNMYFEFLDESVGAKGDICLHQRVIKSLGPRVNLYKAIFLGNDAAKPVGLTPAGDWINDFTDILSTEVVLVSPVISCQGMYPHAQTYFLAVNKEGLNFFMKVDCQGTRKSEIHDREILLSALVLHGGKQIGSLLPVYKDAKFTIPAGAHMNSTNLGEFSNLPLYPPCQAKTDPSKCVRGDPSKLRFFKYGGSSPTHKDGSPICDFRGNPGKGKPPHCEPSTGYTQSKPPVKVCNNETEIFLL
ncbi:hypothetical protein AAMO2058_001612300 [Amorphochlora amoebiformis]